MHAKKEPKKRDWMTLKLRLVKWMENLCARSDEQKKKEKKDHREATDENQLQTQYIKKNTLFSHVDCVFLTHF